MTRALLDAGAQPHVQDAYGRTPLHHAAIAHTEAASVKLLLEWGASPDIRNHAGETPLEFFEKRLDEQYRGRKMAEWEKPEADTSKESLGVLRRWVEERRYPTWATSWQRGSE